jgi:MraZ protein
MLTGTFFRSLDEKQRFAIPKRIRDQLGTDNGTLFLAPGMDGSLAIYSADAFSRLADQLAGNSPTEQDVRAFSRLFYAQAQSIDMDRQGRVRIPPELCLWAGLDKEIALLGVRDHLEVWHRQRWDAYMRDKQPHYDELAERAFDAQIRGPGVSPAVPPRPPSPSPAGPERASAPSKPR